MMKLTDGELEALMPFASGVDLHPKTILMIERIIQARMAQAWDEGYYHSIHSEPLTNPYEGS